MGEEWQQNPGYHPQDGHGPEDSSEPEETVNVEDVEMTRDCCSINTVSGIPNL